MRSEKNGWIFFTWLGGVIEVGGRFQWCTVFIFKRNWKFFINTTKTVFPSSNGSWAPCMREFVPCHTLAHRHTHTLSHTHSFVHSPTHTRTTLAAVRARARTRVRGRICTAIVGRQTRETYRDRGDKEILKVCGAYSGLWVYYAFKH